MNKFVVISLFDYSGIMLLPWAKKGYCCFALDIKIPEKSRHPNIKHVRVDLTETLYLPIKSKNIKIVFAFPPCNHLAVCGARWFKGKGLRSLAEGVTLFATAIEFCEWSGAPYMIENPVSTISTYWRKPDVIFDPYDYAGYYKHDNYSKRTCLWTGNGFIMPAKKLGKKPIDKRYIHHLGGINSRLKAQTPRGFAKAVYKFNK